MKKKRSVRGKGTNSRYAKNPLVEAFARRLAEWRREKGLTLKTVAAETGLSMAIFCEWEHGHRFPSVDHLWAMSKYTGIPAHDFIRPLKSARMKKRRSVQRIRG